jgi:hypothetical protein
LILRPYMMDNRRTQPHKPHTQSRRNVLARSSSLLAAAGAGAIRKPFGLAQSTPLWFYVSREIARRAQDRHLEQVVGWMVAEVIMRLLQADPRS